MQYNVCLNRIDSLILSQIKKGNLTEAEGLNLQSQAYGYDNIAHGLEWLNKRIDSLEMD